MDKSVDKSVVEFDDESVEESVEESEEELGVNIVHRWVGARSPIHLSEIQISAINLREKKSFVETIYLPPDESDDEDDNEELQSASVQYL